MRIETNSKLLILLTLVVSICASVVSAQKKPTAVGPTIWQEIKFERWELKFSVPNDLKAIPQGELDKLTSEENYIEMMTLKRLTPKALKLEMSVFLRNVFDAKVKTERNGNPVEMTAEELLVEGFIMDSMNVKRADSPLLEAKYLEIDGVKGTLVIANTDFKAGKSIKPTNDIEVIWGTFRLSKGNVQHLMFSVTGKRTQIETMKKIINSLKFSL